MYMFVQTRFLFLKEYQDIFRRFYSNIQYFPLIIFDREVRCGHRDSIVVVVVVVLVVLVVVGILLSNIVVLHCFSGKSLF